MAIGQTDKANSDVSLTETPGEALGRQRTAAIAVGIKGQIDGSRAIAQLLELVRVEVGSHRAGDVLKTCLPQHGVVEQTLDQNHIRILPRLAP